MPRRLAALKKKEDIERVPPDQPVTIDVGEESHQEESAKVNAKAEEKNTTETTQTPVEIEVKPELGRQEEDDRDALQKRLNELQRAEKLAKEAEAAANRALIERDRQLAELRQRNAEIESERDTSAYDMILNGLAAAQAESDAAQQALEAAHGAGDYKGVAEAQKRLSRAEARIVQYEDAKQAHETRAEARKLEPKPMPQNTGIDAAIQNLPLSAQEWLRAHPSYVTNPKKNRRIQYLHDAAEDAGHEPFSPAYFQYIEEQEGLREKPKPQPIVREEAPEPERPVMSAPPTRESISMETGRPTSTRVTLTPEERELCRMNQIPEIEYAKQKLKMIDAKKKGLIQ